LTFDWPAIEVGIGSYEEGFTGLTIIRFPKRATVVVDSRGGAPGTVNTDALRLGYRFLVSGGACGAPACFADSTKPVALDMTETEP
jgi:L-aminopeptidase/D-esterase-like protein